MDASADRKSNEINVTMEEPIRILMLFTIMNRGGAETMVMNYYRHIDRNRVQFDSWYTGRNGAHTMMK